ncbi:MAG TPA: gluconeogenesis factor YvcK family protein [Candidatus Paceibacterota bacterium]|nr:gluconeogenesis factor YvcK family protein [Candidatus Paceibacterota bacterium]
MKKNNVVLIGGGVGSSTFTKALKDLPVNLTTIVSAFDDGGSTGAVRRDYGGIALGDFRQCVAASLDLDGTLLGSLNYRFGRGNLFGVNVGNLLLRSFLDQHETEREGVAELHRLLGLKNKVIPVSYDFAKLCAKLSNGRVLGDQQQIADHLSFAEASIKKLYLDPGAKLNPDAREAMLRADYLIFAPGHFFTSVLPHLYVKGFAAAWKRSKAKKIWFVNLLAHRGQDSFYALKDYLGWFEHELGRKPFDLVVVNEAIADKVLDMVKDRFEETKITEEDLAYLGSRGVTAVTADVVSFRLRPQQQNDTIMRAPLRHDPEKIKRFFGKRVLANKKRSH